MVATMRINGLRIAYVLFCLIAFCISPIANASPTMPIGAILDPDVEGTDAPNSVFETRR